MPTGSGPSGDFGEGILMWIGGQIVQNGAVLGIDRGAATAAGNLSCTRRHLLGLGVEQ